MQANLTLVSRNSSGKDISTTISYINPVINSQKSVALAEALNALTNNSYIKTDRTDKFNCDTEETGHMPTPTPTGLLNPQLTITKVGTKIYDVTRLGNGKINLACGLDGEGLDSYDNNGVPTDPSGVRTIEGGIRVDFAYNQDCYDKLTVLLSSDGTYAQAWATTTMGNWS